MERLEFTCGHCWRQWSVDFDVQRHTGSDSAEWEYFALDGHPAESPYTPRGALPCPGCGRHWVGRLLARRPVPVPPGPGGTPREAVTDPVGHRRERRHAPMLAARDHRQPVQPGPPGPGSWTDTAPTTQAGDRGPR